MEKTNLVGLRLTQIQQTETSTMHNLKWFTLSFCIFCSTTLIAQEQTSETESVVQDYCPIDLATADWTAWQQCQGQLVKITGKITHLIMQHPTGLHNTFSLDEKQPNKKHETYLETPQSQLVLTSDEAIECEEQIEVEGIVDLVDLGGDTGKQSYKNVWLKVERYTCQ